ncbi:hypothetical protein KVP09_12305 [Alcaligenaceae bacterium CGII-47]|nr:hypothetical protein [Alcaligenaceae bacterium CGII-47]
MASSTHEVWKRHVSWRLAHRALGLIVACIAIGQPGGVLAGEIAWTQSRVSMGIYPQGSEAIVSYERTALDPSVPAGALVTRVYASRHYRGGAELETHLCWRSQAGPCVLLRGPQTNTRQFEGLSAQESFILVHRVKTWAGTQPPLFVSGTVTVWFALPSVGPERVSH